jgi:hypothetical protein
VVLRTDLSHLRGSIKWGAIPGQVFCVLRFCNPPQYSRVQDDIRLRRKPNGVALSTNATVPFGQVIGVMVAGKRDLASTHRFFTRAVVIDEPNVTRTPAWCYARLTCSRVRLIEPCGHEAVPLTLHGVSLGPRSGVGEVAPPTQVMHNAPTDRW